MNVEIPSEWPESKDLIDIDQIEESPTTRLVTRDFLHLTQDALRRQAADLQRDLGHLGIDTDSVSIWHTMSSGGGRMRFSSRANDSGTFVFISFVAPFQLMDVYNRLLSGGNSLTALGIERPVVPYALAAHSTCEPYTRVLVHGNRYIAKQDDAADLLDYWQALIRFSMRAMYFHEIGHVINSHFDTSILRSARMRRRMEIEADYAGSLTALDLLKDEGEKNRTSAERYFLWGFSLGTMFSLLEKLAQIDTATGIKVTNFDGIAPYPRGGFRGFLSSQVLHIAGLDWHDDFGRSVKERVDLGFTSSLEAWQRIGWGAMEACTEVELREIMRMFAFS
ncbi:hypothetical protein [Streptomyces sp. MA5143a]|uniref:hypothetical protein n=1 Tax=Streptomyces sp. MA5143a TaxID=2083010 RepID=UPI000D27C138|nr:hypothetical protein [Streptomyces sp. MA5143a]SPF05404.1 hypothetical protein SMA5143A_6216 [Streptomyces sp. MA5143a]